jgi:ribosomal protein S18 acetylase RimI-like enzyme
MAAIYTLRPATDDDYDFLYRLHVDTIRPAVDATWGWDDAFQAARYRDHWDPARCQVVVVDGEDAGTLRLEKRDGAVFVGLIEVAPAFQGKGIGTKIMHDILSDAHGRGHDVMLHVLKANPRARRLYARLGFEIVEEREERYIMAARAPVDPSEDAR